MKDMDRIFVQLVGDSDTSCMCFEGQQSDLITEALGIARLDEEGRKTLEATEERRGVWVGDVLAQPVC